MMRSMNMAGFGLLVVALAASAGCGDSGSSTPQAQTAPDARYLATEEPQGSVAVGEARETVEDQQQVTLVGRIGGSSKPFVDGIAAFTIVDPKVQHCMEEEGCPTPWDYCCTQNEVKENIATVKVVSSDGQPVAKDARELLGVKELNLVMVSGKAQRDDQGNLALLADQVYVKQ